MNRQTKFFQTLRSNGIRASYYSMLIALDDNEKIPIEHLQPLEKDGWTMDGIITEKGRHLIELCDKFFRATAEKKHTWTEEETKNAETYNKLFPSRILPSGSAARCSMRDIKERFTKFFSLYDYSWDIIFKATNMYLDMQEEEDYRFCQTSGYFICKGRESESKLASYCNIVVSGVQKDEGFKTRVV